MLNQATANVQEVYEGLMDQVKHESPMNRYYKSVITRDMISYVYRQRIYLRVRLASATLFIDPDTKQIIADRDMAVPLTSVELVNDAIALDNFGLKGHSNAFVIVNYGQLAQLALSSTGLDGKRISVLFDKKMRFKDLIIDGASTMGHIRKKSDVYYEYVIFLASPSSVRTCSGLLIRDDISNDVKQDILDKYTSYAASEELTSKLVSVQDGIKTSARFSMHLAPNNGDKLVANSVILYNAMFGDDEIGIPDGFMFMNIRMLINALIKDGWDRSKISVKELMKLCDQLRPYNVAKGAGRYITGETMGLMLQDLIVLGTFGTNGIVTKAEQVEIAKLWESKTPGIILIGTARTTSADLILDKNALKKLPNFHKNGIKTGLNVLQTLTDSADYTCWQELNSIAVNPDPELAFEGMRMAASQMNDSILAKSELRNSAFKVPGFDSYAGAVVKNISNYIFDFDATLYVAEVKNYLKSVTNDANRGRIPVANALFGTAMPDPGLFFGYKILEDDEVYLDGKEVNSYILTRMPKSNPTEVLQGNYVCLDIIRTRCNILCPNKTTADAIYQMYAIKPDGIIMPAVAYALAILGGSDFDGDRLKIKKILESVTGLADYMCVRHIYIDVESGKGSIDKIPMDINHLPMFIAKAIYSGNDSVGSIVNKCSRIIALMAELQASHKIPERLNNVIVALEIAGVELNAFGHDYVSPLTKTAKDVNGTRYLKVDIKPSSDTKIQEAMMGMKPSFENLFNALDDLCLFNSGLIMRTIDSAKTGEIVRPNFELYKHIKCASIKGVKVGLNDKNEVESTITIYNNKVKKQIVDGESIDVLQLQDWAGNFKKNAVAQISNCANALMGAKPEWSIGQVNELLENMAVRQNEEDSPHAREVFRNMFTATVLPNGFRKGSAIELLKGYYHDLTQMKINEAESCRDTDEEYAVSSFYRNLFAYSANTLRLSIRSALGFNLSPIDLYRLCKYASFTDRQGINLDNKSRFAETMLPNEFVHYVVDNHNDSDIAFCGEKIISSFVELEDSMQIELIDGCNIEKGIVVNKRLTGLFDVFEYEGVFYAAKPIKDVFAAPEIDGKIMIKLNDKLQESEFEVGDIIDIEKSGFVLMRNKEIVGFSDMHDMFLSEFKGKSFEIVEYLDKTVANDKGGKRARYLFGHIIGQNVIDLDEQDAPIKADESVDAFDLF